MGIRFYCPNGHRLNVKSFLAGKRGICPHCSERFRIPQESQIPEGAPKTFSEESAHFTKVEALSATEAGTAVAVPAIADDEPSPEPPKPAATAADPIADSPQAVWYVRPPSGGQYGPAGGDVMRRWIAEGRVTADTLVWRDGWDDWQPAGLLFPSLADGPVAESDTLRETAVPVEIEASPASTSASFAKHRKLSKPHRSMGLFVSLALLAFVLLVALVYVVVGMP